MLTEQEKQILKEVAKDEIARTKQVMYDLGVKGRDGEIENYVKSLENITEKL